MRIPHIGMRTIKSVVSVMISYLLYAALVLLVPERSGGLLGQITPLYGCLAAIICTQGSIEQSWLSGLSRLAGIVVGGSLGTLLLLTDDLLGGRLLSGPLVFVFVLGFGVLASIWLSLMIRMPDACVMASVLVCASLIVNNGPEKYYFTLARVLETAAGVLVALAVNWALPDRRRREGQGPDACEALTPAGEEIAGETPAPEGQASGSEEDRPIMPQ